MRRQSLRRSATGLEPFSYRTTHEAIGENKAFSQTGRGGGISGRNLAVSNKKKEGDPHRQGREPDRSDSPRTGNDFSEENLGGGNSTSLKGGGDSEGKETAGPM